MIGWAVDDNYKTPLIDQAVEMAARNYTLGGNAIFHSDRSSNGGFNRSSQHLHVEVGEWGGRGDGQLPGRGGRRCVRRGGLRSPGGGTGSGSG